MVGLVELPAASSGSVKKKLAKRMAQLASSLLASGAMEPPSTPLDVPPRREWPSAKKK